MKTDDFINMFNDKEKVNYCELIKYEDNNGFIHHRSIIKLKCSCGEIFETTRGNFTDRNKNRCDKCIFLVSKGEDKIRAYLVAQNIKYIRQYCFDDCRGVKRPLPFDFAIFDNKNNLMCLIEYDGKQHFEPVNFGGCSDEIALQEHENLKQNDQIKNEYCKKNNIKLIRIPYWEFDNIEEILAKELQIEQMKQEI